MKRIVILLCLMFSPFLMASDIFTGKAKKPGIDVFFIDSEIIQLTPDKTEVIEIKLQFTAESVIYELSQSEGLIVNDLQQSSVVVDANTHNKILTIPLELRVSSGGRYHLHFHISSYNKGVETQGVISKIISTDVNQYPVLKKPLIHSIHILPSSETILSPNLQKEKNVQ